MSTAATSLASKISLVGDAILKGHHFDFLAPDDDDDDDDDEVEEEDKTIKLWGTRISTIVDCIIRSRPATPSTKTANTSKEQNTRGRGCRRERSRASEADAAALNKRMHVLGEQKNEIDAGRRRRGD
jgi:hypothetical protein